MADKKTLTEEAISKVITALATSADAESVEIYREIIGENGLCAVVDPEAFYFKLAYPFEQFLSGYIRSEIANNDELVFLMLNCQFVEQLFGKEIKNREGWPCSADKSGAIIQGLANFFRTGSKIAWNYKGEYTYHLPKKVFTTHDSIIEYFNAIRSLYYGNSDKYLEWLASNDASTIEPVETQMELF